MERQWRSDCPELESVVASTSASCFKDNGDRQTTERERESARRRVHETKTGQTEALAKASLTLPCLSVDLLASS